MSVIKKGALRINTWVNSESLCMHILPDSQCLSLFHEARSVPWRNAVHNLADESYSSWCQSHDKTVREFLMRCSSDSGLCFTTWVGLDTLCQFDCSVLSGGEQWDECCLVLLAIVVAAQFGSGYYVLSLIPDDNPRKLLHGYQLCHRSQVYAEVSYLYQRPNCLRQESVFLLMVLVVDLLRRALL